MIKLCFPPQTGNQFFIIGNFWLYFDLGFVEEIASVRYLPSLMGMGKENEINHFCPVLLPFSTNSFCQTLFRNYIWKQKCPLFSYLIHFRVDVVFSFGFHESHTFTDPNTVYTKTEGIIVTTQGGLPINYTFSGFHYRGPGLLTQLNFSLMLICF